MQAAGAEKVEAVDNMYSVTKELSSESQNFRLDFYFQGTSEGKVVLSTSTHSDTFLRIVFDKDILNSSTDFLLILTMASIFF